MDHFPKKNNESNKMKNRLRNPNKQFSLKAIHFLKIKMSTSQNHKKTEKRKSLKRFLGKALQWVCFWKMIYGFYRKFRSLCKSEISHKIRRHEKSNCVSSNIIFKRCLKHLFNALIEIFILK